MHLERSTQVRCTAALLVLLAAGSLAACSTEDPGQPAAVTAADGSVAAAEQGEQLSRSQAAALEQTLQASPDDLNAREQLVGYYFIAQATDLQKPGQSTDPSVPTVARDRQLVWLIQHAPGLELLGTSSLGVVQPTPDAVGYAAAKDAWMKQVAGHAPAQVEGNAGIFFAQTNDPRAIDLLTAAEAGDTRSANWPDALSDLYLAQAKGAALGSPASRQAAASAVSELEKAWSLSGSAGNDPRLSQMAKLAVVAGEDDKAARYAAILLSTFQAGAGQGSLAIGGPLHDGNMVLGQVALRKGDKPGAEQYLLKAGATPGSPSLDRYGPNFSLAHDLLVAGGSTTAVLRYCDEVASFWGDPRLAAWRATIAAGKMPDFGDNLWN